jgi:cytochrome c peroxidase
MKFAFVTILLIIAITIWGFSNTEHLYSKASLGKLLFNEKILSKDSSVSCSSCHNPNLGFADTLPFSVGVRGKLTKRNTPSVLNMKNRPYYFWDGRSSSLEEQSLMPIQNPDEMGLPIKEAVYRLNQSSFYKKQFQLVFNSDPNQMNLAAAIAAFESTLETSDSKFDDWANNKTRLSASEERGRQVFLSNKAKCFECHFQIDFTNDDFKNIGLFNGNNFNDSGRFLITRDKDDLGKFKTPGLRNIGITSPYMHNGIFKTLEEVVDYYNDLQKVVPDTKNLDPSLSKPLGLTNQQKKDLVAFLKTLTDKRYAKN